MSASSFARSSQIHYQNPCDSLAGFWRTFFKLGSCILVPFTFPDWSSFSWRWRTFRATKHRQKERKWRNLIAHPWRLSMNDPWAHGRHWNQFFSSPGDVNKKFEHVPNTHPWKPQSVWPTTTWSPFPILPTLWTSSLWFCCCFPNWKWNWRDVLKHWHPREITNRTRQHLGTLPHGAFEGWK
jgi:hypothetical protein